MALTPLRTKIRAERGIGVSFSKYFLLIINSNILTFVPNLGYYLQRHIGK